MDTYEKRYKNALTIAQSRFKIEKDESVLTCLGMMFPELHESEDERTRKKAIAILKQQRDYWSYDGPIDKFPPATPRRDLVDAIDVALSYLEKQKEQKPVDYDHEMWKNCEANFEGGKKEVIENPERYGLQKPAEWSEEDEDMLNSCISSIEEAKENRYAYKETDGDTSYDHEIEWLKSLRPYKK